MKKVWIAAVAAFFLYSQTAAAADQTPAQVQELVAPIALYPDALVAQVLGASTHPNQVAEADQWMQQHPNLQADELAQEVNSQPWDPSVKALTQFPSVLTNLDRNESWTMALGDAYASQQQAVLDAVQVMRQRAQNAGTLESTPQQSVIDEGSSIMIEPANPDVLYVPAYDPWEVYGSPLDVYPGWVPVEGAYIAGPGISFGIGFGLGFYGGFGWGWSHWHTDWHDRRVMYDHRAYEIHRGPRGFYHDHAFHGGPGRVFHGGPEFHGGPGIAFHGGPGPAFHGGYSPEFHGGNGHEFHGGPAPVFHGGPGPAFHGGVVAHAPVMSGPSMAGRSSFGGMNGGFHGGGGGGGFHGGGGGGGFHGGGGGGHR
jgi:uncharacterized membrane protein YgcG